MKIEHIDVDLAIDQVKRLLAEEKGLSPAFKGALEVLLALVSLLLNRATLNSRNSSKLSSSDPNRKRGNGKEGNGMDRKFNTTFQSFLGLRLLLEGSVGKYCLSDCFPGIAG